MTNSRTHGSPRPRRQKARQLALAYEGLDPFLLEMRAKAEADPNWVPMWWETKRIVQLEAEERLADIDPSVVERATAYALSYDGPLQFPRRIKRRLQCNPDYRLSAAMVDAILKCMNSEQKRVLSDNR